ncbi:unnamed protein product [Ceratitis capitata]|uniref:(Mediterranean fruit fly) hypothetical protein n=1 Tax=Ceratitis capitata TaxID=7213 RepID=A0A811VBU0_CERCA|nr:unnamed protein product [Ceratitis capitata]
MNRSLVLGKATPTIDASTMQHCDAGIHTQRLLGDRLVGEVNEIKEQATTGKKKREERQMTTKILQYSDREARTPSAVSEALGQAGPPTNLKLQQPALNNESKQNEFATKPAINQFASQTAKQPNSQTANHASHQPASKKCGQRWGGSVGGRLTQTKRIAAIGCVAQCRSIETAFAWMAAEIVLGKWR